MKTPEKQLIQAIQRKDLKTIEQLKTKYALSELLLKPDSMGATPLQWALWIHHPATLEHLGLSKPPPLITRNAVGDFQTIDQNTIYSQFQYINCHHICFEEAHRITRVIRLLRFLFRLSWLEERCLWLGAIYKNQLAHPQQQKCTVRFINKRIGYGVFAEQRYNPGEYIGEYVGVINLRHLFSRLRDTTYLMDYPIPALPGFRWSVDAQKIGNFTRFINHHESPNCSMNVAFDGFILRLLFLARNTIYPGQELTLNYGSEYWKQRPNPIL